MGANKNQVIKNIAVILKHNPEKVAQLERVLDITLHLTGGDGCYIDCELYDNDIVRYIITGTRSNVTLTADLNTLKTVRKPRGAKPWFTDWENNFSINDIIDQYERITKEDAK